MPSRSILVALAHPDDESGMGGTLARYVAEGVHVALICATRGEVGEISDPALATPETLGEVREGELRCATEALGINELLFLNYRDSGMAGTPPNNDPRAFAQAPADAVVPQLVEQIRLLKPQVVITFDPEGGYGHPDHIAIHKHTVAAFHAAGDETLYPDKGPPWQPSRLFYVAITRSFFQKMAEQMAAQGIDTSGFGDMSERGWPDDQVTATIDVSDRMAAKWKSFECHRTQFGPNSPFLQMPQDILRQIMSSEHFVLAWPEPAPELRLEDLFAGL